MEYALRAQCPQVLSMLIDACPTGQEENNEYILISSGNGFNLSNLTIDYAMGNNAGFGDNNDVQTNVDNDPMNPTPCGIQPGDLSVLIAGSCNVFPVGAGANIPAGAILYFQTSSNPTQTVDISFLCAGGQDIYVARSTCTRTIGAFTNGGSGFRTTNFTFGGGCAQSVTYDRSQLPGGNGAYFNPCNGVYGNDGCGVAANVSACLPTCPTANVPTEPFLLCFTLFPPDFFTNLDDIILQVSGGAPLNVYLDAAGLIPIDPTDPADLLLLANTQPSTIYASYTENGCESNIVPIDLVVEPFPTATGPQNLSACLGSGGQGTYDLTTLSSAIGGGNMVTYTTDAAGNNPIANPGNYLSAPGQVYATVTTANGCTSTTTAVINLTASAAPSLSCAQLMAATGPGVADGTGQVTVSGGTPNYTVSYTGPVNGSVSGAGPNITLTGLEPGNYSVSVQDADGCTSTTPCQLTIDFQPSCNLMASVVSVTDVACNGENTGSISLTAGGNVGTLGVQWSNGQNANQLFADNLTSSNYSVTVTDNGVPGCEVVLSGIFVDQPAPLVFGSCQATADATAPGANDGAASVMVSGGTPPYTINYSGSPGGSVSGNGPTIPISGLGAGTYGVFQIVDANGCSISVNCSFTINEPVSCNLMVSVAAVANAACNGESTGSISLVATGQVGTLNVQWSNGQNANQLFADNLASGSYSVTITDNGVSDCEVILSGIFVDQPASLEFTSCQATSDVTTPGANDGAASVTVSGGTPPYTINYSGSPGGSVSGNGPTIDITGLGADTYEVFEIVDANNCSIPVNCSFTINEPTTCTLDITCTPTETATDGGTDDGAATITTTGGTPPFDLDLVGPAARNLTGLAAGTIPLDMLLPGNYTATLTDADGCTADCSFFIDLDPTCDLLVTVTEQVDVTCLAAADGFIQLDTSGLNGDLGVQWSTGNDPDQLLLDGLTAGSYSVTVTDLGLPGCDTVLTDLVIGQPDTLILNCLPSTPASGPGASDGTGVIGFSGGTPPYSTYLVGQTDTLSGLTGNGATFGGLMPGTYTTVLTDANGCTASCTFTVTALGCPLAVSSNANNISCSGAEDGSITLTITDNNGPPTVTWSNTLFNGQQDISELTAGDYSVTVTDAVGCVVSVGPIVIEEPDSLALECSVLNDVTNPNGSDGSARGIITGGTAPYEVVLSRTEAGMSVNDTFTLATADTLTFTDLLGDDPALEYTLVVTDESGCRDTCGFAIFAQPCPQISVTETITNVACPGGADGSISLAVTDAQEPIGYQWTPTLPDTNTVSDLTAGTYEVMLTDSFGCTFAATYEVLQPDSLLTIACQTLTDESAPGANDGSASIDIMGDRAPFTLELLGVNDTTSQSVATGGPLTLTDLAPDQYQAVVTDANGCVSDTCSFIIASAGCTLMGVNETFPADCNGNGLVILDVSGGSPPYDYDWSDDVYDGQDSISVPAGTYAVTVSDAAGCEVFLFALVEELDNAPQLTFDGNMQACQNDSAALMLFPNNGSAPYGIHFTTDLPTVPTFVSTSGDTTVQFPVPMGTTNSFVVTIDSITDANGCATPIEESLPYVVSAPDTLRFNGNRCTTDTITLEGIEFFAGNPTDTFLVPNSGCGLLYEVDFDFFPPVVDTLEQTLCPGDSLVLDNVVFNANNPEGLVDFGIVTATGCDSLTYVRVDFFPISQSSLNVGACAGDTVRVGDDIYTIADADGVTVLPGAAASGCDSLIFVTVNFQPVSSVVLVGGGTICQGDSVALQFNTANGGPFTLTVQDGAGNTTDYANITDEQTVFVSPDFTTTYTLVAASQAGANCPIDFSGTAQVEVSRLQANLVPSYDFAGFQIRCHGGADGELTVRVTEGNGPYDYHWSDGIQGSVRSNLGPGNYELTLTDAAGCSLILNENLQEPAPLLVEPFVVPPGCNEREGVLNLDTIRGGVGPYEISLDGAFFQSLSSFPYGQPLAPGSYELEVLDLADCAATFEVFVPEPADPDLILTPDTVVFLGDSLLLSGQTNFTPDSIRWEPSGLVTTPGQLSTYATPLESSRFFLFVSDSTGCRAEASVFVQVDERVPIFVPTAFSPNTDGSNDIFRLFGDRGVRRIDALRIFDRWGELVYEQLDYDITDPTVGWDGRYQGKFLNPQVLIYQISATLSDGREVRLHGDITLLR